MTRNIIISTHSRVPEKRVCILSQEGLSASDVHFVLVLVYSKGTIRETFNLVPSDTSIVAIDSINHQLLERTVNLL